jgi:hypothetical protein
MIKRKIDGNDLFLITSLALLVLYAVAML